MKLFYGTLNLNSVPFTFKMVPLGNGLPVVRSIVRMVNSGAKGLYTRVGSPGTRLA